MSKFKTHYFDPGFEFVRLQNCGRQSAPGVDERKGGRDHARQAKRSQRGPREPEADGGDSGPGRVLHAAVSEGSAHQQPRGAAAAPRATSGQGDQQVAFGGRCREYGGGRRQRRPPLPPSEPRGKHDKGAPAEDEAERPRPRCSSVGPVRLSVKRTRAKEDRGRRGAQ